MLAPAAAAAEVYVDAQAGFYDSRGTYTAVGSVRNGLDAAVLPEVTVSVRDGGAVHSETFVHVPVPAGGEAPFKMRLPGVSGASPELLPARVSHDVVRTEPVPVSVIYDGTLVLHPDGHLTGRVHNTGDYTVYNPKVFAVVHGEGRVLDVAQNVGRIASLAPGETAAFAMYPDPAVAGKVSRYSCFAPVDSTVIPVTAQKNGGDYDFRYDSGAWYSRAEFDDSGTVMTIRGYNSYPLETYANFELPPVSGSEEFYVTINGEPVEFVQSVDAAGMWHVAYSVEPASQGVVEISGFAPGLPEPAVPGWVRDAASAWAAGGAPDRAFLDAVSFLADRGLADAAGPSRVPEWVRGPAGWWAAGGVSDAEFFDMLGYLAGRGHLHG